MRPFNFWSDRRGASAIEFALTAPAFFMVLIALIEGGLLLWTQIGLQHGAEMAARCATIDTSICSSTAQTQSYAAQQSFGINPPPSTFTVTSASCGNQVTANYQFALFSNYFGMPSLQISAQSCFPT
jgi:Flp pilus assembly protein TadG